MFLNIYVDDQTVCIKGYTFERKDRDQCNEIATGNRGGILMYIANHVTIESQYIESTWIEVHLK